MTRSDLYMAILPKLVAYLFTSSIISEDERDEVKADIILDKYDEACSKLMTLPAAEKFKKVVKGIKDGIGDNNDIENPLPVRHHTASNDDKDRLMEFCYKSTPLAVLPVKTIISEIDNASSADIESICGKIIDLIWLAYKNDDNELKYLWECCQGQHESDYFLLTTEADTPDGNWRLYSYGYYCFVNSSRLRMPTELEYDENKEFVASIAYDSDNKYEQYFDVYNVMSESKYSKDVLTRYLRMYQILEYLGFRKTLADMTKGNIRENGFVRNVISRTSKSRNDELEELKKGLSTSFPLATIISATDFTVAQNDFIRDKLMVKNTNHDDAKIWEVVYKLRNCIVHNKESELHFTYANTSVYNEGIGLMKKLIEKLEPAIVAVINDHGNTNFDFPDKTITLY